MAGNLHRLICILEDCVAKSAVPRVRGLGRKKKGGGGGEREMGVGGRSSGECIKGVVVNASKHTSLFWSVVSGDRV
jgi:hypothetical protein